MSAAAEFPRMQSDAGREGIADLRLLFERAGLGAARFEPSGKVIALNSALERLLGARSRVGQDRSLRFGNVVPPVAWHEMQRLLGELFAGKRESFFVDIQIAETQITQTQITETKTTETRTAGSGGRTVRWTAWRVAGAEGEADFALALAQDAGAVDAAQETELAGHTATISAGVQATGVAREEEVSGTEQRLQRAEKLEAMGRLAGGVAHDFNNVLTGIVMYCDLMLASLDSGHPVRKYAEEIRSAGVQATGLVKQLMAISRPRSSDPGLISLNETIGGMRSLLGRLIGENIVLRFQLEHGLGRIKMDLAQAQQVLLNLVLNARDAMPGGGEITIETSHCRIQIVGRSRGRASHLVASGDGAAESLPCALFVVRDTGSGMDAETRAHLFETFYTTKPDGRGTGLGLATVHKIVTSNGGLIHVASAPGRGTRISILLPLAQEENSQTVKSQSTQSQTVRSQASNQVQAKTNEGALP